MGSREARVRGMGAAMAQADHATDPEVADAWARLQVRLLGVMRSGDALEVLRRLELVTSAQRQSDEAMSLNRP